MRSAILLIVTAVGEAATGLLLLIRPSVLIALLLGVDQPSPETNACARILGAALLAIGAACWFGRTPAQSAAQFPLLIGVLVYDAAAAAILVHTGLFMNLVGIALWPAVGIHAALAGWCIGCFVFKPEASKEP